MPRVLSDVIAPRAERTGREGRFPRGSVTALGEAGLLGLTVSADLGGGGRGVDEAAEVVARVAGACPATAAVLQSHYAAVAVIEACGSPWVRGEIAVGRHLSSLALADRAGAADGAVGASVSRSGEVVALRARKREVVAAGEADSYVWSSLPLDTADGLTLWLVPAHASDLFVPARPDGTGPQGSATATVLADPVLVPADAMLGEDGVGGDIVLRTVLPWLCALRDAVGAAAVHPSVAVAAEAPAATGRPVTAAADGAVQFSAAASAATALR
ncbi:acyl-CoA dehydrogenase family protein [Actinacidiphila sp. bgisy167]|uniref:acyl-CoA dehydrogenase family protein n=1 Tax=Actinacidiphila sp. bgisy167 TaxID=3413797 RepID=UPI003D7082B8